MKWNVLRTVSLKNIHLKIYWWIWHVALNSFWIIELAVFRFEFNTSGLKHVAPPRRQRLCVLLIPSKVFLCS
jgi:hypothetical protein